jgi:hypothetical protein
MDWTTPLLGFVAGLLVGMTGIDGAALMTRLLILLGGVRPVVAVGTDLGRHVQPSAVHHQSLVWRSARSPIQGPLGPPASLPRFSESSAEAPSTTEVLTPFLASAVGRILRKRLCPENP